MAIVQDECHVVVKRQRDTRLLFVKAGATGAIGKVKFEFSDLIGRQFGVPYEVKQKRLHPCNANGDSTGCWDEEPSTVRGEEEEAEMEQKEGQVSPQNVEKMRRGDASNNEIVTKSANSDDSLRHKTAYAREKYMAKKARKHSSIIVVHAPSIRLIHEIYYLKDADKMAYLRQDCLAHLVTWSNIHHGCSVAVVEQCLGVVTAAVLERMAGAGQCVRLHKGPTLQSIPCLGAMDYSEAVLAPLLPVPIEQFVSEEQRKEEPDGKEKSDETKDEQDGNERMEETEDEPEGNEKRDGVEDEVRLARREQREARKASGLRILRNAELDSFIIAVKHHPLPLTRRLMHCARPSRPFVVYCAYVQPLLECYQWIRESGVAVNVRLFDNFYRKYQVLPGRSHPEMNQPVAAGYLLTGVTVSLQP